MEKTLYHYKAIVTDVYDGDTISVEIDLGLHTFIKDEKIRLNRINAPEVKGKEKPKGIKSRDFLRKKILGKEILLETIKDKDEKYGRYLGEIFLEVEKNKYVNINDLLVEKGFAEYKNY
ncbi:MAG: thermonuclease family protein [Melioribacteraceae bacterium]|nr:thermonuclease family protein [Melioribacteraceae bacterium]